MSDDERPPEITPWGDRDEPDKLFGGFWWVTASRHGGLYLTTEQRKAIPESLKAHSRDEEGIWWEENSAWSLPVMCLLSGRPESSLTEEEQEKLDSADQTCRDNYPREWEELTGRKLMPGESRRLDDAVEEKHRFDESGPLERGARFHTLALAPDEDERARKAGRMHIQVLHPGDEGNEFIKIYAVAPAIMRELELLYSKPAGEELALWLTGKGCKLDYEDGPAVVEHRADGGNRRTWYRDGHWHCDHGPALREYAANGSALFEDYFLDGSRVAKDDVVFPDREKFDALLAAAKNGETAEVNRLVHSGANIHGRADAPLRAAAFHGHGETVRALVAAGAEVDAWDGMAVRCMVHRGDTETVKFLLEKGANIFAIEDKVIEDIERQGHSELADVLRDAEAKRLSTPAKEAEAEPIKPGSSANSSHITVNWKTPEGHEITCIYAVSKAVAGELERMKEKPGGADLGQWLGDRGCPLDCASGPAQLARYADGSTEEAYFQGGKLHREDGPARIARNADGSAWEHFYFQGGKLHREGGPARIERKVDGSTIEGYYRDDELHREDGPAQIERDGDGSVVLEEYFMHGWRVAKEDFEKHVEAERLQPQSPSDEAPPEKVEPQPTQAKEIEAERLKPESPSNEPQHKKHRGRGR